VGIESKKQQLNKTPRSNCGKSQHDCQEGFSKKRSLQLLLDGSNRASGSGPCAIGLKCGSVLLPLSPSRCLLIDDYKYGNKLLSITREKTAQINALIIAGAHEAVFANLVSKDIAKVFDGTVRGENTTSPIRRA
jgi:hypothetical protein